MTMRTARRAATLIVIGSLIAGGIALQARAESSLERALRERRVMMKRIERLHEQRHEQRVALHQRIRYHRERLQTGARRVADRHRRSRVRKAQRQRMWRLRRHELELIRDTRQRVRELKGRREQLADWIQTYGVFRACPVSGPTAIADNFGITVEKPGTPRHVHMGNDITAPYGAPIVAPFDGVAEASTNSLGGLAVKVYGEGGYVYNAHLSSYGKLGEVRVGDVIGYVGTTGNAGGPHDHFEWHPFDGGAVDPNPYLLAVC